MNNKQIILVEDDLTTGPHHPALGCRDVVRYVVTALV
jgi:hypothetical protein